MAYQLISPSSKKEWQSYFDFRWQILRKPWQQPRGTEKDELEYSSIHKMLLDKDHQVVASGRIHFTDKNTAQIRYMAVSPAYQGQGLGTTILNALEKEAAKYNINRIFLHARENAKGFYLNRGYSIVEPSHTLYNSIKHYLMEIYLH